MTIIDILLTVAMWDAVLGTAMLGYIWLSWARNKKVIVKNGWNLDHCTPFEPWWAFLVFYVPILGIAWYLTTGDLIEQLANKVKPNGEFMIIVGFGPIQIQYFD